VLDGLVLTAAIAGAAVNGWLLWQNLRGGSIAGCGGGPCDAVTSSRWGYLFGWPVSAFGLLVYTALLGSFIPVFSRFRLPLLALPPGAAAWFVFVQAVFLKDFCPVCNSAHAIGLVAFIAGLATAGPGRFARAGFWAAAAFLTVGLLQVYGPLKTTHRIEEAPPAASRQVSFDGGKLTFDPVAYPLLGSPEAEHVLVEYFDYQCAACRAMAGHLDALIEAHPGRVAVLLMPVPLEAPCNPYLGPAPQLPGSCEISRTALAVWRARPAAFPAFHKSLLASPSSQRARSLATESMTPAALATALNDPWIDTTLRSNVAAWRHLSRSRAQLPKLLLRDRRVLHGLPSNTEEFLRVIRAELGL
jgi:hypothetical protein